MGDTELVEGQAKLAKSLAADLPGANGTGPVVELSVAGAATRALRWLGEEARQVRLKAEAGDVEDFLTAFAQLCKRARALEPVAAQLRPRWGEASSHLRMYQWCREVAFTVWAAACPQPLRTATTARRGALPDLDVATVRSNWAEVQSALAAMDSVNPDDFHEPMEAELAALRGAAPVQKVVARDRIPREHQSRPMGKGEAAKLHAGFMVPDAAVYFDELIAKGIVTAPIGSGRQWRFDVREFPASKQDQMR
jgi:hypothetical protein